MTTTFRTTRHTTSSRKPGVDTGGSHAIFVKFIERCEDCGRLWYGGARGTHSPVLRLGSCGHFRKVNCIGAVVVPCCQEGK
jgi:hypothetical protein